MIHTYYTANPQQNRPPTPQEIQLVKIYLSHWYNHPGFYKTPAQANTTNTLIYNAQTNEDLIHAIQSMLEQEIDPL